MILSHLGAQGNISGVRHDAHSGLASVVGPARLVRVFGVPEGLLQFFHPPLPVVALVVVLVRGGGFVLLFGFRTVRWTSPRRGYTRKRVQAKEGAHTKQDGV